MLRRFAHPQLPPPDMAEWIRALRLDELSPGSAREVLCGERIVALFRVGDTVWAMDGICPHQGGPLGEGVLRESIVTCPWHGWQFDVTTGRHTLSPTICQPTFPVWIDDGEVFVDVGGSD